MDPMWSATEAALEEKLQLGMWTNWSRGKVLGATWTLTKANGNLLIAFTALFIALVASRVWRIACLVAHRYYSTSEVRDALHHQRQAILRNVETAAGGLVAFAEISWAWRGTPASRHFLRTTAPMIIFSVVCSIGFVVAGGFSSWISTSVGDEVLIDGTNCSVIVNAQTIDAAMNTYAYRASTLNNAANYAQQCYHSSNSSGIFECSSFAANQLPGTMNAEAPCPFDANICRTNTSNVHLDTGYIDSLKHLGLNTPENERMLFRHTFHCAPLETDGHTSLADVLNEPYVRYHYGNSFELRVDESTPTALDYAYTARNLSSQYRTESQQLLRRPYNFEIGFLLATVLNGTVAPWSLYKPMPELIRPDGDLYLIFLEGNGVGFYKPTDDLWYRGNRPANADTSISSDEGKVATFYQAEEAASPMACIEQFQFCSVDKTNCGPLASFEDAISGAAPLFNASQDVMDRIEAPSSKSAARFLWFVDRFYQSASPFEVIFSALGPKALASQLALQAGLQGPIPTNQWQLDVRHWWAIWLASIQAGFVNMAKGTPEGILEENTARPEEQFRSDICGVQKIRSAKVVSFSLFALYFNFLVGLLLILVSYILEPILGYLWRRRGSNGYAWFEWTTDSLLQLQRLGYEGAGSGTWSKCTGAVPITNNGETLESLDVIDHSHPRIGRPISQMDVSVPCSDQYQTDTKFDDVDATKTNGEESQTTLNDADEAVLERIPTATRPRSAEAMV